MKTDNPNPRRVEERKKTREEEQEQEEEESREEESREREREPWESGSWSGSEVWFIVTVIKTELRSLWRILWPAASPIKVK